MTPESVSICIRRAARELTLLGMETPELDARLLMQAAAGLSHADIVADPGLIISGHALENFKSFILRRKAYEPVSRILGLREFYGRAFTVTPDVLDPRGDTETLVATALRFAATKPQLRILDLGTGSGAIVITLLAEHALATGVATDISPAALAIARANAMALRVSDRLQLVAGNWFEGVTGRFDLIVSNPPYIPHSDISGLSADVRHHDPLLALDGGPDGLAAYRAITAGAGGWLAEEGRIMVEIGAGQGEDVREIFENSGFVAREAVCDLGGHLRCLGFGN